MKHRLLHAAETLRARLGRSIDQALRNHSLFCTLLSTGLRISEVIGLDCDQFTGRSFEKVRSKGGDIRNFIPMERDSEIYCNCGLKNIRTRKGSYFRLAAENLSAVSRHIPSSNTLPTRLMPI